VQSIDNECLVKSADGVVVKEKKFCDFGAGLPHVEQKDDVHLMNPLIFAGLEKARI
jgi:hypothetical protein